MSAPRTWWNVSHPAHPARLLVAARRADEDRALAWMQWYGRTPRNELEVLAREACSAENSEVPADSST